MRKIFYLFLLILMGIPSMSQEYSALETGLRNKIQDLNAEIGIALNLDGKKQFAINDSIQYPLMSVMKFHQAIAVLHTMEEKGISLDSTLLIRRSDLRQDTWSPLREKYGKKRLRLSIRELLEYTLLLSDNNACDLLFDHFISPTATSDYLKTIGLSDFNISVNERKMNLDSQSCYNNWSSPSAAVCLLEKMLEGKLLSPGNTEFLKNTMMACKTGDKRLPGFPHDDIVRIGHKTGTGGVNAKGEIIGINDIGFFMLPDGRHYSIAVFIKNSKETMETNEKTIAEISEATYHFITRSEI